jgi:hypothetical protein
MLDHRLDIVQRIVWDPEKPHSLPRDHFLAQLVMLTLVFMRFPIYLDSELRCVAIEIDDKPFDHLLTTEVKTVQRVASKSSPERAFRWSHLSAESLCKRELLSPNVLTAYDLAALVHEAT